MSVVPMHQYDYARKLEAQFTQLGIRCTSFQDGTFQVESALTPSAVENQIISVAPNVDVQLQEQGMGSKGTVRIANIQSLDE